MRNEQYSGPDFDGETYDHDEDYQRLGAQMRRVFDAMASGDWVTLRGLSRVTGDPEASVSARLRDLRKAKFGGWEIRREKRIAEPSGRVLWIYRLEGKAD